MTEIERHMRALVAPEPDKQLADHPENTTEWQNWHDSKNAAIKWAKENLDEYDLETGANCGHDVPPIEPVFNWVHLKIERRNGALWIEGTNGPLKNSVATIRGCSLQNIDGKGAIIAAGTRKQLEKMDASIYIVVEDDGISEQHGYHSNFNS